MMSMKRWYIVLCAAFIVIHTTDAQVLEKSDFRILPFGEGGQIKMLYDRRQRPQSVYLNGKVHLVINAGGEKGGPGKSKTKPMALTYDLVTGNFSNVVILGSAKSDHHYAPVIWADENDYLHVLYGCHKTPGTHLVSKNPGDIGASISDWNEAPQIAPSISYPTFYQIEENKELIYYRTAGHISSWTYRISSDNSRTWTGPAKVVTDLDSKGRFEWSSYQCKLPSKDGRFLHVVFTAYDDNRQSDPERFYNSRYNKAVSNEWKYNLYYAKIDLQTDEVTNFAGESMNTPIDLDQAKEKCLIWDTEGRGAGVPPDIVLDNNDNPAFLHVLSEETTEKHNYYFVHRSGEEWKKTVIAPSNHQWNSCHVNLDKNGMYHTYLVVGDSYVDTEWVEGKSNGDNFEKGTTNYLSTGGFMDKHGGGKIEEWVSADHGNTWKKLQELTPDTTAYPRWKFNNIQPVTHPDGSTVDGMLMFYGWKYKDAPEAKAFLLVDNSIQQNSPVNNPVRYLEAVFENTDVQKDIEFGEVINYEGNAEKLLLDIYSPAGDQEENRPAILWIHGGGFRVGNDKSQKYIVRMAMEFARRGYVCLSINYRVRHNPKDDKTGTMTQALEDVMTGLNWLKDNSKKLKVDRDQIIVGGGSAGGMIAVNLCFKNERTKEKWDKNGVVGLVNLWGSPDDSWKMSTIDSEDPPTIIVHGTEDQSVPFRNTERLAEELKQAGVKYEVVAIDGAGHTPANHMDEFNKEIANFLYELIDLK